MPFMKEFSTYPFIWLAVASLLVVATAACTSPETISRATVLTPPPALTESYLKLGCCFLKDLAEAYVRGSAGVDLKATIAYRRNGKGEFGRLALDVSVQGTKQDIRTVEQRIMEIGGEHFRRDPGNPVGLFPPSPTEPPEEVRDDYLVVLLPLEALVTYSKWPEVVDVSSVSRPCSNRYNTWHPVPFPTPQAQPLTVTGPPLWQTYTGRVYLQVIC